MTAPVLRFPQQILEAVEPPQVDPLANYKYTCMLMVSLMSSFKEWVGKRRLDHQQMENLNEEFLKQFYRLYCGKKAFGFTEPISEDMIIAAWEAFLPHIRDFCR